MRRDIGGAADLVFVARHQRTVLRDDEIGFDVVRTLLNRDEVARECVFRHIPARTAVRYDKWPAEIFGRCGARIRRHENCARERGHDMKTESPAIRHCNLISSWVALMKSIVRGSRKNKVGHAACLAFAGLIGACASDPRPVVLGTPLTLPALNDYCAVAQKEVATARVPARNMLMNDYQSFS